MEFRRGVKHRLRDLAFREAGDVARHLGLRDLEQSRRSFDLSKLPDSKIITVKSYLPLAVARRARQKVYAYPHPLQKQKQGRVIRTPLHVRSKMVPVHIKIRVPARLPLVRSSYVSVHRGVLNVHSANQLSRVVQRRELNRRRYVESKRNRRFAAHGQLDSPGASAFGSVAYTAAIGGNSRQLADAALIARAVLKGRG